MGIFYRSKYVLLIVSFWIKSIFVVVELALAIAFGVLDKVSNRQNSAAIVEWGASNKQKYLARLEFHVD